MKKGKRMSKEEIERKKKIITRTFFAIVIFIVLIVVAFIVNDYIILDKNKTTNLIINNRNVTSNLKKDVLIEDDTIYLSKQDVANFFDKYIYEENDSNKIITTYDKKIAEIGFEENIININGSDKNIYAHAIKKDEVIYLPISEMKDVYGIEIQNIEGSKVVTIDSTSKEQKRATVTKDLAIKSSTNFIAKTIDRVKKGQSVVVVSKSDNGWARVRTENRKIRLYKI